MSNDRSRSDDGSISDGDSFQDGDIHANPDMVSDYNGLRHRLGRSGDGMIVTVPDTDILADDNAAPYSDALKTAETEIMVDIPATQAEGRSFIDINPGA